MEVKLIAITNYLDGDTPEELLAHAGRVCYRSRSRGAPGAFLRARIREGHESIIEHGSATFEISGISRVCSHQLVRHRLASYSQESQRYCQYGALEADLEPEPLPLPEAEGERRHCHCKFTLEQEQFITDQYMQGFSCERLAEAYDVHPTTIRTIIISSGRSMRTIQEAKTLHTNTAYFSEIDTPEKAYALGLIYADGNVAYRGGELSHASITQHADYRAWLRRLGALWGGTVVGGGHEKSVRLTIPGKDAAEHLVKHGVVQAKSRVLTAPVLPGTLIPHFVRGYLDGDGYIGARQPRITMTSGSRELLEWILQQVRIVTDKGSMSSKDSVFRLTWAGSICVPAVLDWLYRDFDFRLSHPARLERAIQWSEVARDNYFEQVEGWASRFEVIVPPLIKQSPVAMSLLVDAIETTAQGYANLRALGIRKEDARFLLPNATATRIVMSANLREWRHVIKLRTDPAAQWEIRELANRVLDILYQVAPSVFQDLVDARTTSSY